MAELVELAERPEVQEKLRRRIQSCDVKVWTGVGPARKDRRTCSTALHTAQASPQHCIALATWTSRAPSRLAAAAAVAAVAADPASFLFSCRC
jgi:hypothetical protein